MSKSKLRTKDGDEFVPKEGCLHCYLAPRLKEWLEKYPDTDPQEVICMMMEVLYDLISGAPPDMMESITRYLMSYVEDHNRQLLAGTYKKGAIDLDSESVH